MHFLTPVQVNKTDLCNWYAGKRHPPCSRVRGFPLHGAAPIQSHTKPCTPIMIAPSISGKRIGQKQKATQALCCETSFLGTQLRLTTMRALWYFELYHNIYIYTCTGLFGTILVQKPNCLKPSSELRLKVIQRGFYAHEHATFCRRSPLTKSHFKNSKPFRKGDAQLHCLNGREWCLQKPHLPCQNEQFRVSDRTVAGPRKTLFSI